MVKTTPVGLMSHHFNEILNDANFDIFYHAPVLIVISTMADIPWAVEDCALAAENLMLAARGAGLGTCWIGFAQGWLGTPEGKALLKLPAAYKPVAPDHRRPSEIGAAADPAEGAGNPLDRWVSERACQASRRN